MKLEIKIYEGTYTILKAYGTNEKVLKRDVEEFWNKIQEEMEVYQRTLMIIRDLYEKIGSNPDEAEGCVEKFGNYTKNTSVFSYKTSVSTLDDKLSTTIPYHKENFTQIF